MGALNPETPPEPALSVPISRPAWPLRAGGVLLLGIAAWIGLPPLLQWRQMGEQRALSLSNIRRIGTGALLYAQDWDGRLMPLAERESGGDRPTWHTWPETLRPYVSGESTFENPSNPTTAATSDPTLGCPVHASYAFNRRFWNVFSPGPFPLENLELSEQTAMFVEAGPFWSRPTHKLRTDSPAYALLGYGDTTDRWKGLVTYPSTHDGRMAVVAADGHGIVVTVEHYDTKSRHDPLYGRIGGSLYDWNGGHPNGETDRAPRE
jgi:hypothetical protein